MRARSNIYHIECFRCIACSRKLTPGDEFALKDQGPLCKVNFKTFSELFLCYSILDVIFFRFTFTIILQADHEVLEKNKFPILGSETTNSGSRITCNGSSNSDIGQLDPSDINGNSISSSNCSNSPTNQLQMAGKQNVYIYINKYTFFCMFLWLFKPFKILFYYQFKLNY